MAVVNIRINKRDIIISLSLFLLFINSLYAQEGLLRAELESGIVVVCRPSYQIFLECFSLPGKPLNQTLTRIFAISRDAQKYGALKSAAIPLQKVQTNLYPKIFLKLFESDPKDAEGWIHIVPEGYIFDQSSLNLWAIALTGSLDYSEEVLKSPRNMKVKLPLHEGDSIFFPIGYLVPELRTTLSSMKPKPKKSAQLSYPVLVPLDSVEEESELQPISPLNGIATNELEYGKDSQGEYALYRLKRGETMYRVIVRFTDYSENSDILEACKVIKKRSNITDERSLEPGTVLKIPLEMLSDSYQPKEKEERRVAEEVKKETEKIKKISKTSVSKTSLKGHVIIIDPGHGGKDHGAPCYGDSIFEDEVNYDIACRLKKYLEQNTQAKVYITLKDDSDGYEPVNKRTFRHDNDEYVQVTPPCNPQDFSSSANLRWLLANSIMRKEEKSGIPRDKMIFVSIHCDFLYKSSMRGLMIYIPGANYRNGIESLPSVGKEIQYSAYKEWKEHRPKTLTKSQLIKEEARSRAFAQVLINSARKNNIAVHSDGPAIRNVIRRSKRSSYVPAVLRNTEIPTKVLVECANLNNPADLKNTSDPTWRQKMAETIANAIEQYFAR